MDEKREGLSIALKKVVVQLYQNGEKIADIAQAVNKSLSSIYRVIRKFQNSGSLENRPRSGRPRLIDEREYRRLQRLVNVDCRAPLSEVIAKFNENRNVEVSNKTVKR
jgi:transposase